MFGEKWGLRLGLIGFVFAEAESDFIYIILL